jgi:hypothetical protein
MDEFYRNRLLSLAPFIAAMIFFSCTSTRLSNVWRDTSYNSGPMTNILVIAVKKDATRRRIWEDGFSVELARHNVTVTPSYRLFPTELPDTNQVVEAVKDKNFDGVLVVSRLAAEKNSTYVPGYTTTKPVYHYSQLQREYFLHYEEEYHPGYTDSTRIVQHEVNVWTTKDGGRMIWSGTGQVLDPGSSTAVNNEIVNLIIPELVKDNVLSAGK